MKKGAVVKAVELTFISTFQTKSVGEEITVRALKVSFQSADTGLLDVWLVFKAVGDGIDFVHCHLVTVGHK